MNEQLSQIDIYHAQWTVIYYLHNSGVSTLVEISNYFDVEKPTITRTANRLQKRGLIELIPGKDKWERRIQLTDLGVHVYEECQKVVDEFEQNIMNDAEYEHKQQTL